jgi:hypothetical protein
MKNINELIATMVGKVFTSVTRTDSALCFENDTEKYLFAHTQDCCEEVYIEDLVGDIQDLIGSPITFAEKSTNAEDPGAKDPYDEDYLWTYYKFATIKGWVDVRWYGSSNGWYSMDVDLRYTGADGKTIIAYLDE